MDLETTVWFRPVGPKELALIAAGGYRAFPPRLPEQPIFYPVLNEEYARQIARDWSVPASGAGFVVRFALRKDFADRYPVQTVGGSVHKEMWVPAEDLAEMNRNIVGQIEVIAEFRSEELSTGDAQLIEHTTNDHYWADGGDGTGKNRLGQLLMELRAELRGQNTDDRTQ